MKVGFVGWRGMVGSVLLQRMRECGDFEFLEPVFFSTSQAGNTQIIEGLEGSFVLKDAAHLDALAQLPIILSCQGGDYTKTVHRALRDIGWDGYWLDASSALRMQGDAIVVLDPINRDRIAWALNNGVKDFIGGNCTVSLMLLALHGILKEGLIDWISSMTYQAASGAGAQAMKELLSQMGKLSESTIGDEPALDMERRVRSTMLSNDFPQNATQVPLAGGVIPWIDDDLGNGRSREEWKGEVEANKILGWKSAPLKVEGICVRVGTFRCHGQALTFKLNKAYDLRDVGAMLDSANDWVKLVDNDKESTLAGLSTAKVSGTMNIPVGRLRQFSSDNSVYSAFTLGDQLLWGAAEPLRRALGIVLRHAK